MFKKSDKWDVKAIILVALIGIIMGVIYTYAFNNLYNLTKLALLPTGYAPVMDMAFSGLWFMAAPLAIYFVPAKGSGILGELLASIIEMAIGGQWGALTVLEGLIQGAANEIGFFPKKERYERFSWVSVLTGAFCASLGAYISQYFLYGWFKYSVSLQLAMLIAGIISGLVFDGVLVKLITKLFDQILRPEAD